MKEIAMSRGQNWIESWRLLAALTLSLIALSLWIAAMRQFEVEGVRMVIRFTARSSLLLFCLAFSAAALARLWPNTWTRWQRRNRRYLGVSFAVSHFIHLGVILALASVDQALFWKLTNISTIVLAGSAYLFIAAMAATSFDRTAAWLGPRKWRLLHLVGGWYIWISFAVAVGKRVPLDRFYWPMAALVLAAAIVRLLAMSRRNRRQAAIGAS
jgi:DMSO/TMAO reductase YedYZ heme-binding membrane subunit